MARRPLSNSAGASISFVVMGTPRSAQARRGRRAWMETVRSSALEKWGIRPALDTQVSVTIVYFYRLGAADVDNIIKLILDALIGVIYDDDRLVAQVVARKTELTSGLDGLNPEPELADAVDQMSDFVYIRIEAPPDHRVIP